MEVFAKLSSSIRLSICFLLLIGLALSSYLHSNRFLQKHMVEHQIINYIDEIHTISTNMLTTSLFSEMNAASYSSSEQAKEYERIVEVSLHNMYMLQQNELTFNEEAYLQYEALKQNWLTFKQVINLPDAPAQQLLEQHHHLTSELHGLENVYKTAGWLRMKRLKTAFLLYSIAITVISVYCWYCLHSHPLKKTNKTVSSLNVSVKPLTLEHTEEIEGLSEAVHNLHVQLQKVVLHMNSTSIHLSASSQQLHSSTEEKTKTFDYTASQQTEDTLHPPTSMEEIQENAISLARLAEELQQLADSFKL